MSKPHSVEYVQKQILLKHNNIDVSLITNYINNITPLPLICLKHNLSYEATFSRLISKNCKSNLCPSCIPDNRNRDLSKEKFGMLQPIKISKGPTETIKCYTWLCKCDCGNEVELSLANLTAKSEKHLHCVCIAKNKLNESKRLRSDKAYGSWKKMLARAGTNRSEEYKDYYSDVTVCKEWDPALGGSYENFYKDMGSRPEDYTLNRINSCKIYSKETCEWTSLSNQSFDQCMKKTNKSGRTGVKWRQDKQVWEARITKNKKIIILYYGSSFEDACKAREEAELKYFGFIKK